MFALLRMFGVKAKDRLLTREDFYVPNHSTKEEEDQDKDLTIEVKIEFPELYDGRGKRLSLVFLIIWLFKNLVWYPIYV